MTATPEVLAHLLRVIPDAVRLVCQTIFAPAMTFEALECLMVRAQIVA